MTLQTRVERIEREIGIGHAEQCELCADITTAVRVIGAACPTPDAPFCSACGRKIPLLIVADPYSRPGQRR